MKHLVSERYIKKLERWREDLDGGFPVAPPELQELCKAVKTFENARCLVVLLDSIINDLKKSPKQK